MAITSWPRLRRLESPSGAAGSVTGSIDAQQRQIGVGIVADQPRGEVLAVRRCVTSMRAEAAVRPRRRRGCW